MVLFVSARDVAFRARIAMWEAPAAANASVMAKPIP